MIATATNTAPLRMNASEVLAMSRIPRARHSCAWSSRFRRTSSTSAAATNMTRCRYSSWMVIVTLISSIVPVTTIAGSGRR
jgi:hypothetical protein